MQKLVTSFRPFFQLPQQLRRLNQDERGDGVQNVMWIAVGVLILVAVVAVVGIFFKQIKEAVMALFGPDGGGNELPDNPIN
jgi:hypothetical protein